MIAEIIKLFKLFDKKDRSKLILTQLLLLLSAIFEILSIFSIGPLIQILSNPDIIYNDSHIISKFFKYFEFNSFKDFLLFVVFLIFSLLFVSTIILTYSTYFLSMFSAMLGQVLRNNLFKFFISQEWIFHSRSSSSEYIEKVSFETGRVASSIILPALLINAKLLTGILIIISLTIYNPLASIVCFTLFGSIYFFIFKIVKTRMLNHGVHQGEKMNLMFRVMSESFLGIKEAIVYGNQKNYYDMFAASGEKFSNSTGKITFLGNAPKYILEFLAIVIIILFIVFILLISKTDFNNTLPVLTVYIFAGYKLLPILQQIYFGSTQIKSALPAFKKIETELRQSANYSFKDKNDKNEDLDYKNIHNILLKDVSFSYDELSKKAVKNISLNIKRNSLNYIVGPSGSGKSTLLDVILGLIFPKKGEIFIGNIKLDKKTSKSWHSNIGYVSQNVFLIDDTIKNNICFNSLNKDIDEDKFTQAIKSSCVDKFIKDLPKGVNTIVGDRGIKLSGGQRQRVALARAFYQDKKILILDEATASLDGIVEKLIFSQLKEFSKNKIVIMVTHNVSMCNEADEIYLLNDGSIKEHGNFDKLKNDSLFQKLLNEL
jgi:ATP-binding cassette, subfamily B, bacterial PglK